MKIEVVCPRGHKIPKEAEGFVCFSPLGDERLNVRIECFKCGLRWEMSLRLFTCTEERLEGGNIVVNMLRQ